MKIKIYLLNSQSEVYQTFPTIDQLVGFFNRTGRVKGKIVIIANTENGKARVLTDPSAIMEELSRDILKVMESLK